MGSQAVHGYQPSVSREPSTDIPNGQLQSPHVKFEHQSERTALFKTVHVLVTLTMYHCPSIRCILSLSIISLAVTHLSCSLNHFF